MVGSRNAGTSTPAPGTFETCTDPFYPFEARTTTDADLPEGNPAVKVTGR